MTVIPLGHVVLIAATSTEKLWKNEPLFDNQSMTGKKNRGLIIMPFALRLMGLLTELPFAFRQ